MVIPAGKRPRWIQDGVTRTSESATCALDSERPSFGRHRSSSKAEPGSIRSLSRISASGASMKQAQMVYLEEDIWEEKQITPGRKTKILKHRAGSSVPYEEAKKLGLV